MIARLARQGLRLLGDALQPDAAAIQLRRNLLAQKTAGQFPQFRDHFIMRAPLVRHRHHPHRDPAEISTPGWWTQGSTAIVSDRKSTRLNSSHLGISYAVFCLK